jgi:hypothetical protein
MADEEMFQLEGEVLWKVGKLAYLAFQPFHSKDDMSQETSFIRIVKGSVVRELIHFAQVMEN